MNVKSREAGRTVGNRKNTADLAERVEYKGVNLMANGSTLTDLSWCLSFQTGELFNIQNSVDSQQ